jgi:hypothetical protein
VRRNSDSSTWRPHPHSQKTQFWSVVDGRKVYTAVKNRFRKFFYNPSKPNLRQQRADGTWIANLKEVSAMIPVGLFTVRQADYADAY